MAAHYQRRHLPVVAYAVYATRVLVANLQILRCPLKAVIHGACVGDAEPRCISQPPGINVRIERLGYQAELAAGTHR